MGQIGNAMRLGEYLLRHRILTDEQLREAQYSMAGYGGRLGTNLVRLGLIELDELAAHLSEVCGVPLAPLDWLENPEPRAAQILPMPLIRKYKLLPLRLDRSTIHVAMRDPNDAKQIDFIATASERRPIPYVLPEIRLFYWLETHLGIDRHPRYVNLIARSRQPGLLEESQAVAADSSFETPLLLAPERPLGENGFSDDGRPVIPQRKLPPIEDPVEEDVELLLVDEFFADTPAKGTPPGTASPSAATIPPPAATHPLDAIRTSSAIAALEAEIDGASDRDEIVRLALRIATTHSRAAALFVVRGGIVSSYRGDGAELEEQLEGIGIPIGSESIFTRPATITLPFRGEPPDEGIDGRTLQAIGRGGVQEVLVHPIMIRGRVINLLYADNGPDPFGETSVAALAALCACIARAYERIILAGKSHSA